MSFSGLKTAVLRERDRQLGPTGTLHAQDRADLCAGFQAAVVEVFASKARIALASILVKFPTTTGFAVAGGVASNTAIRGALETVSRNFDVPFFAPPLALCTDNAAMIAWAGIERYRAGHRDNLTLSARPRWPLDTRNPSRLGSGKKGAKA